MTGNALVLGGGGVLGVAWEAGILAALAEAGVDVTKAELIGGTSAGSVVGSHIACGRTAQELLDEQFAPREGGVETQIQADISFLVSLFQKWAGLPQVTPQACAEIGAMALAARTMPEASWVDSFAQQLPAQWPERPLLLTAVDAETGAFQTWDRGAAVDLPRAVASSCAVPGLFPPVRINGRRYMDGGVRSGTSADLAQGYDNVLIIAPIGAKADGIDPLLGRATRAEAEALRASGSTVELLMPDAAALQAIGINRMDAARRPQAAEAGMAQGKALASRLDGWTKVPA